MKTKIKLNWLCAVLLSATALFSCKDDEPEVTPPVPPVISISHSISGIVVDKNSNKLADVDVNLTGDATLKSKTDANGTFTISGIPEKGGKFKLTFSKTGKHTTFVNMEILSTLTTAETKVISVQLVDEGVKKEIAATGGQIAVTPPTSSTTPAPEVKFTVPTGALSKTETITITPINDIVAPAGADATKDAKLPLLTLNCAPSGLKFSTPCPVSVPNPFGTYSIGNMNLFLFDDKTSKWTNENMAAVTFKDGTYNTFISHFSNYQISFEATIKSVVPSTEPLAAIESVDNLSGNKAISVNNIDYKMKGGYSFVITTEAALTKAGITGDDAKKLSTTINDAIISKNGGMKPAMSDINASFAANVSIPVGVRLDIKGTQKFNIVTYVINLNKPAGGTTTVEISVKQASTAAITTRAYTKEHQGGGTHQGGGAI